MTININKDNKETLKDVDVFETLNKHKIGIEQLFKIIKDQAELSENLQQQINLNYDLLQELERWIKERFLLMDKTDDKLSARIDKLEKIVKYLDDEDDKRLEKDNTLYNKLYNKEGPKCTDCEDSGEDLYGDDCLNIIHKKTKEQNR